MTIRQVCRIPGKNTSGSVPKWVVVFTILLTFLAFYGNGSQSSNRMVIINSDDAGMCSSVNKGTIAALEFGLLRSTSIMTCCPAFEEFAVYAKAHPQHDYGVHLTLTCDLRKAGWGPILPPTAVPSLVGKDGFFHPDTRMVAELADLLEVESELRAQIAKAQNEGIRITHFDNHMFVLHERPEFMELYVKLAVEFGVPIRFSRKLLRSSMYSNKNVATRHHAKLLEQLDQAGLRSLDRIESENYSIYPAAKQAFFLNELRHLQPGVLEIVIHCASPDDSGIEPPDAPARYADGMCVLSRELLEEISRSRVRQIDWGELKTLWVGSRAH